MESKFPGSRERRQFLAAGGATLLAAATSAILPDPAKGEAAPESCPDQKAPHPSSMKIQRLAWAGIKIECGDAALFVDASVDPDYGANNIPLATSAGSRSAVVTHHHGDHCDPVALKPVLGASGRIVCHREVAGWFDARGIPVQTVELHEPVFFSRQSGDIVARAVPASDGFGHPQFSWVIDVGGKRIIHCGDTMWHGHWYDIAGAYGPFDAALLPINGFRQVGGRYVDTGVPMSLTPEQALSAARIIGARLLVPIHYGSTGDPSYIEVADPEANFLRVAKERGMPARIVPCGEYLEL
jgi:L-ascorbate metabolism protein UlaG (beta-lactamase superfamily)